MEHQMRLPYVQQKELEIENTLDKIRNQLAAMRSQDATLHRQVSRIKANIEDITLEIQAMTRSRLVMPTEANRTVKNGDWHVREPPISSHTPTSGHLLLQPPEKIRRLSVSPRSPLRKGTSQFYEPVVYEPVVWDEGTPATLGRERSVSEPKARLSGSVGSVNSIASTSSSRLSSDMQTMSPLASADCDKEQDTTEPPTSPSSSTSGKGRRRLSRALSSFRRARVGRWLLRRFSTTDQNDPLSGTETETSTTI